MSVEEYDQMEFGMLLRGCMIFHFDIVSSDKHIITLVICVHEAVIIVLIAIRIVCFQLLQASTYVS